MLALFLVGRLVKKNDGRSYDDEFNEPESTLSVRIKKHPHEEVERSIDHPVYQRHVPDWLTTEPPGTVTSTKGS